MVGVTCKPDHFMCATSKHVKNGFVNGISIAFLRKILDYMIRSCIWRKIQNNELQSTTKKQKNLSQASNQNLSQSVFFKLYKFSIYSL